MLYLIVCEVLSKNLFKGNGKTCTKDEGYKIVV